MENRCAQANFEKSLRVKEYMRTLLKLLPHCQQEDEAILVSNFCDMVNEVDWSDADERAYSLLDIIYETADVNPCVVALFVVADKMITKLKEERLTLIKERELLMNDFEGLKDENKCLSSAFRSLREEVSKPDSDYAMMMKRNVDLQGKAEELEQENESLKNELMLIRDENARHKLDLDYEAMKKRNADLQRKGEAVKQEVWSRLSTINSMAQK